MAKNANPKSLRTMCINVINANLSFLNSDPEPNQPETPKQSDAVSCNNDVTLLTKISRKHEQMQPFVAKTNLSLPKCLQCGQSEPKI